MYCQNCGQKIDDNAVVCVHCGVATGKPAAVSNNTGKSWVVALLLCLFLGGFGAHRFYVGKTASGITMLLITLGFLSLVTITVSSGRINFPLLMFSSMIVLDLFKYNP